MTAPDSDPNAMTSDAGDSEPDDHEPVKLAFVVQRYGQAINGGAELHARYIAERLARHADVEVLTTCATDYVTWRNELPAGVEQVNGVPVRRFRVKHERDPIAFGRLSERVFNEPHSIADELDWLDAEGPTSPALIDYIAEARGRLRLLHLLQLSLLPRVSRRPSGGASRAILVPTAERDSTIGLSIFKPIFRGVRALMYNSPEERAMIQAHRRQPATCRRWSSASARKCRHNPQPARFRQKFDIRGPFAVYVGRIDENKGCQELFDFFRRYLRRSGRAADARPDRQLAARDPEASAHSSSRVSSTTSTSSTPSRPPSC